MESTNHAVSEAVEMGEAQRDQLLLEHLPQVHYIARRIHDRLPPQVPLEDLVHAGILGLMDAVHKYNPSKNVQLKHYAKFRIRGAILDSLREGDWSPRALRKQARSLEQAHRNCKAELGREPIEPELASAMGMSLEKFQQLLGDLRGLDLGSLQAVAGESGDSDDVLQYRPEGEEESPFYICLRSEMTSMLTRAIDELPGRDRQVLALYHFEELTMKEVAAVLGIGESRVSQIHTEALLRLRSRMHADLSAHMPAAAKSATAHQEKPGTNPDSGRYRRAVLSRARYTTPAKAKKAKQKSFKPCDFRQSGLLSKEQVQSITFLHENVAPNITNSVALIFAGDLTPASHRSSNWRTPNS